MTQTIEAVYDGLVFRPDEPLQLEANTRIRLVVEEMPKNSSKPYGFLDAMLAANLEGPPDFSTNIDHYLYGVEKGEEPKTGE
jgi:hypothetical protein